jgi:hypothetical protein
MLLKAKVISAGLFVILALGGIWMAGKAAQDGLTIQLTAPAASVPASLFGIHIHRPSEATWPQIPFAEWRLWDSYVTWHDLEPQKGRWNFTSLDNDVALAQRHGVGLLLTLGQSPAWASMNPDAPPHWRRGGSAPPTVEADWKKYVQTVVTRYKGRIEAYEIWNEPNSSDSYTGTVSQLVALAKDAY